MLRLIRILRTLLSRIRKPNGGPAPGQPIPPALQQVLSSPEFWRDLNADYYDALPDEWKDNSLYLRGERYEQILETGAGEVVRLHHPGEWSDEQCVRVGAWKIWQVGRTYTVVERLQSRPV